MRYFSHDALRTPEEFSQPAFVQAARFKNKHLAVMAAGESAEELNLDYEAKSGDCKVKIICLGDSAVGKSK